MWIVVWHIALLVCVAVLAWRVAKVHATAEQASASTQKVDKAIERLIKFLDARDSGQRIERATASRRREVREKVIDDWMAGQNQSLGKLSAVSVQLLRLWSSLEEEALAPSRNTVEMPAAAGDPLRRPTISRSPPVVEEPCEGVSWEELKREGLIGRCVVHAKVTEPSTPERGP